MEKGFVQIYTGDGKGKTTAALGLALRAAGHGFRTYIAQFMKGQSYGELKAARSLPEITIEQFGKNTFTHINKVMPRDIQMAKTGLAAAAQAMLSQKYQLIILDEINVVLHFQLLSTSELLYFIALKPPDIELILTGRHAPQELINRADLVTEMRQIKHYYSLGISARIGIEK
jgi:cob(I)alamin adenosyltransferase